MLIRPITRSLSPLPFATLRNNPLSRSIAYMSSDQIVKRMKSTKVSFFNLHMKWIQLMGQTIGTHSGTFHCDGQLESFGPLGKWKLTSIRGFSSVHASSNRRVQGCWWATQFANFSSVLRYRAHPCRSCPYPRPKETWARHTLPSLSMCHKLITVSRTPWYCRWCWRSLFPWEAQIRSPSTWFWGGLWIRWIW